MNKNSKTNGSTNKLKTVPPSTACSRPPVNGRPNTRPTAQNKGNACRIMVFLKLIRRTSTCSRASPRGAIRPGTVWCRSEEHTSELQSRGHIVCRLLLEKKKEKEVSVELNNRNRIKTDNREN